MTRDSQHVTLPGLDIKQVREFSRLLARGFEPSLAGSQIGLGPNEAATLAGTTGVRRQVQEMKRLDNTKPLPDMTHAAKRKCLMCRNTFNSEGRGHRVCDSCKKSDRWKNGTQEMAVMT